jgi:hypothetical protein
MRQRLTFWIPRANRARGKVRGALPRTPARGKPPETPAPFPFGTQIPERSSPSRVRCAAPKPRALDCSGPFRRLPLDKGKGATAKAKPRHPTISLDSGGPSHGSHDREGVVSRIHTKPHGRRPSPRCSRTVCCDARYAHVYFVALGRLPQRAVRYASVRRPSHASYPRASPASDDDVVRAKRATRIACARLRFRRRGFRARLRRTDCRTG